MSGLNPSLQFGREVIMKGLILGGAAAALMGRLRLAQFRRGEVCAVEVYAAEFCLEGRTFLLPERTPDRNVDDHLNEGLPLRRLRSLSFASLICSMLHAGIVTQVGKCGQDRSQSPDRPEGGGNRATDSAEELGKREGAVAEKGVSPTTSAVAER